MEKLLQGLNNGEGKALVEPSEQAAPPPGWEVRCDVNGCSIVRVAQEEAAPPVRCNLELHGFQSALLRDNTLADRTAIPVIEASSLGSLCLLQ